MRPSIRSRLGFDDRLLMLFGLPVLAFLSPVVFFGKTIFALGWAGFAPYLTVSLLYANLYWWLTRYVIASGRKNNFTAGQTRKRILTTAGILITMVLFVEANCNWIISWLVPDPAPGQPGHRGYSILQTAPVSMLIVLGMTGLYEAVYYFQLHRRAEVERERLLRIQAESQLEVLSKQVSPHFLFNSLNTLIAVLPPDAEVALVFTEHLSGLYRRLLEWNKVSVVTVREELAALSDYEHLLKVRLEDRLARKDHDYRRSSRSIRRSLCATNAAGKRREAQRSQSRTPTDGACGGFRSVHFRQ
jgi:hypothetical protein